MKMRICLALLLSALSGCGLFDPLGQATRLQVELDTGGLSVDQIQVSVLEGTALLDASAKVPDPPQALEDGETFTIAIPDEWLDLSLVVRVDGFLDDVLVGAASRSDIPWESGQMVPVRFVLQVPCSDGFVGEGEECDDGNVTAGDGCTECAIDDGYVCPISGQLCEVACGNGELNADEVCDDGNDVDGDGCTACAQDEGYLCPTVGEACVRACGNGEINGDEACDDGNEVDGDGCTACAVDDGYLCPAAGQACVLTCGNGVIDDDEACDDGNEVADDGCTACLVDEGYVCPEPDAPCEVACGNGDIDLGEQCDDGNVEVGDGCDGACDIEPGYTCLNDTPPSVCFSCGDGAVVAGAEECDDGNNIPDDGCSDGCVIEDRATCIPGTEPSVCGRCGNGVVEDLVGEECDDPDDSGDCAMCRLAFCGDTFVNLFGGGGEARETCDLGDDNEYLGDCSDVCLAPACGNGLIELGEACDSGGAPGCAVDCSVVEPGFVCAGMPSVCVASEHHFDASACAGQAPVGGMNTCLNDILAAVPVVAFVVPTVYLGPGDFEGDIVAPESVAIIGAYDAAGAPLTNIVGTEGNGMPTILLQHVPIFGAMGIEYLRVTGAGPGEALVQADGQGDQVYVFACDIGPSDGVGIRTGNNVLVDMRRNIIHDNAEGGVEMFADNFQAHTILSNIVHDNGTALSTVGGMVITGGADVFFNTIVDNRTINQADLGSGVSCGTGTTLTGNIIWGNLGAPDVDVACPIINYSVVQGYTQIVAANGGTEYGAQNSELDPLVGPDFRVGPGSICLDYVDAVATFFQDAPHDVLNNPRPHPGSGRNDCGAFESAFYTPAVAD